MWKHGRLAFACSASGITSTSQSRAGAIQLMRYFPFIARAVRIVHYRLERQQGENSFYCGQGGGSMQAKPIS